MTFMYRNPMLLESLLSEDSRKKRLLPRLCYSPARQVTADPTGFFTPWTALTGMFPPCVLRTQDHRNIPLSIISLRCTSDKNQRTMKPTYGMTS
ncbi:hypothetical protein PIB30_090679 [Stylosanthes scabra]|uniref:Uncharacterized protein n=1 Tax=Stylosanthes scabra TaxID=79078 RepID=A0ABU6VSU0_9FABA|nr:hypothetical protein [Stylosanthes scabra]